MKTLANLLAIAAMAAITYFTLLTLPTSVPFHTEAPIWTLVITVFFGTWAWHDWQPMESGRTSPLEWIKIYFFFLTLSPLLFLIACWLRDVPLREGIYFPEKLWSHHPAYFHDRVFWWSMLSGPGATLVALGSLIRIALLKLFRIPPPTTEEIYAEEPRPRFISTSVIVVFIYFLMWILAMSFLFDLQNHRGTSGVAFVVIWIAAILGYSILLARMQLARLHFTLGGTIIVIALLVWGIVF